MIADITLEAAMNAAVDGNPQPLAALVPAIVCRNDRASVTKIATGLTNRQHNALPELLALFNVCGGASDKSKLLHAVFAPLPSVQLHTLQMACARIGAIGFSFPKWRYLTQGFDGSSLIERFGMIKNKRKTDIRDAALPDPHRDELGIGFTHVQGNWYIEYRRSYILCANMSDYDPSVVLIRNSSYFYGRDRLREPVYVSWRRHTPKFLHDLDANVIAAEFEPLTSLSKPDLDLPAWRKLLRLARALDHLESFDKRLNVWLFGDGAPELADFLQSRSARTPFIAAVKTGMPPWFVRGAVPGIARADELRTMAAAKQSHETLILTTGRRGDFAVKPRLR